MPLTCENAGFTESLTFSACWIMKIAKLSDLRFSHVFAGQSVC